MWHTVNAQCYLTVQPNAECDESDGNVIDIVIGRRNGYNKSDLNVAIDVIYQNSQYNLSREKV